jgi:hypothetical protein
MLIRKSRQRRACSLINDNFYNMNSSNNNRGMYNSCRIRGTSKNNLVPISGLEIWRMPKDITTMKMRSEVYTSTWEMHRLSPMDI